MKMNDRDNDLIELEGLMYEPERLFDKEILTIADVATLLNLSTKKVYSLAKHGEIPCKRVGRQYRFLHSNLIAWMKGD